MSNGTTHWCFTCNQPIMLEWGDAICPYCHGGFIQELNNGMQGTVPHHQRHYYAFPSQAQEIRHRQMPNSILNGIRSALMALWRVAGPIFGLILYGICSLMRQLMAGLYPNLRPRRYVVVHGGHPLPPPPPLGFNIPNNAPIRGYVPSHSPSPSPSPPHPFGFTMPNNAPVRDYFPSHSHSAHHHHHNHNHMRADSGDYFEGPGLEELIERLGMDDESTSVGPTTVPSPSPSSSVNAMPTVKITQSHLRSDSMCAICQENFVLGSEAKAMPCNHIFHSDCISPWLAQHNSCPVCRVELPSH